MGSQCGWRGWADRRRLTRSQPMSLWAGSAPWTRRGSATSRSAFHPASPPWARAAVAAAGGPLWRAERTPPPTGLGDSLAQEPGPPSSPPLDSGRSWSTQLPTRSFTVVRLTLLPASPGSGAGRIRWVRDGQGDLQRGRRDWLLQL